MGQPATDRSGMPMIRRPRYKRPMDLFILVVAHVLLASIWILIWLVLPAAIWVQDRGPVFYRQRRAGRDGVQFSVLKFRTMIPDADRLGAPWKADNDPRVTRVGRVLRRTALDELPQVINILKGEMSFVGPRALDAREQAMLEQQIPGFGRRLLVRPGLTGLAQVNNRIDDAAEKLRLDLAYIETMSPWLDAKILFRSVVNTVSGRWDRRTGKTSMPTPGSGKPGDDQGPA